MEVIEIMLYRGAHEFLKWITSIEVTDEMFEMIYKDVHPIYDFFYDNFHENALVINYNKRISTAPVRK